MGIDHHVFVMAGQAGSKSTFIGGLYQHVKRRSDYSVSYRPEEGATREDFTEGLIQPMLSRGLYPDQTDDGYVVKVILSSGSRVLPDIEFNFVDIPGEKIDIVLNRVRDDVINDSIEDDIDKKFNKIQGKLGGSQEVTPDEWETVLKRYYDQSTMVMFLGNIHKISIRNDAPTIDTQILDAVAEHRVKAAFLPTAVDLVDFDPGTDSNFKSRFGTTSREFDQALMERINNRISEHDAPAFNNLLAGVEQNTQVDFFGTSVPPADPTDPDDERLEPHPDGGFKTKGFDKVIEWLKD